VFWLLVFALFAVPQGFAQEQWSIGYWTPRGNPAIPPSAIDWQGLTHVVHAWAIVKPDGSLDLETQRVSADAPVLIHYAHTNGVKAVLGIVQPYWSGQTTNLQQAITRSRSILADNIMKIVDSYGFDGVDLDWEPFDSDVNGPAMQALAADLRSRLGPGRTLSAAAIVTNYTFWGKVHSYFDRIGLMTYDLSGLWDPYTWHNSALYDHDSMVWSVDLAVRRFTANGVPAAKLAMGIPFFGYKWTGIGILGPGLSWIVPPTLQQIPYNLLAAAIDQRNYRWDSFAKVPYLSVDGALDDNFYSYDNALSVTEKVRYAEDHGLGGWIIWELASDYLPSQTPNQPLLDAIKSARKVPVKETLNPTKPGNPTNPSNVSNATGSAGAATNSEERPADASMAAASATGPSATDPPSAGKSTATVSATRESAPRFFPENHIRKQNEASEEIRRIHDEFYGVARAGGLTVDYVVEKAALVRAVTARFVAFAQSIGSSRAIQGGNDIAALGQAVAGGFERVLR
jgi:chitinase